jgi:hypothetical protein
VYTLDFVRGYFLFRRRAFAARRQADSHAVLSYKTMP